MPARGVQSTVSSVLDVGASQLICSFGGNDQNFDQADEIKSPGLKFATDVVLTGGIEPSYATISIPIAETLDEVAPTVACVGTGPTGKVKLISRCRVDWYDSVQKKAIPVMAGSIITYHHDLGSDTATALVVDDRWLMEKVCCHGKVRAKMDPRTNKWTQYFDNSPLVFGQWGPDCVDVDGVGPRFSSDWNWGLNSSLYVEPALGTAKTSARSWTCMDIWKYLTQLYTSSESCSFDEIIFQGGAKINRVQDFVYTPGNGGTAGINLEGFYRVKKNFSCHGKVLTQALQDVCRAAGAYDLYCQPIAGQFRSMISVVDMNPKRTSGVIFNLPSVYNWDLSKIVADPAAIQSGRISESVANYHDQAEIVGDGPLVELMCSYPAADAASMKTDDERLGLMQDDTTGILEPAWTAEDEAAFKAKLHVLGDDEQSFNKCCEIWPQVYCAYRVNPAGFVQALSDPISKYADWTIISYPRINTHLLSNNLPPTVPAEGNPNNFVPKEIHFEWWDKDPKRDQGFWERTEIMDGLALSPERTTILIPALRSRKFTWKSTPDYDGQTMRACGIRATIAVEIPTPLRSASGSNGNGPNDPNWTASRVRSTRQGFIYTGLGQPDNKDYIEYLRLATSRPNGTDVPQPDLSDNYPVKSTLRNELFTDKVTETEGRQPRHAKARLADVKRVEYTGQLIMSSFHPALRPGVNVRVFGGGSILPIAVIKSVRLNANEQNITVELASHDSRVIYDLPVGGNPENPTGDGPKTEDPSAGNTANPSKSKADATAQASGNESTEGARTKSAYKVQKESTKTEEKAKEAEGKAASEPTPPDKPKGQMYFAEKGPARKGLSYGNAGGLSNP